MNPDRVLDLTDSGAFKVTSGYTVPQLVNAGIVLLITVAGVGCFVYLLYGGVQWILAGGEKEGLEKAKKNVTNALIGLVITLSAYALFYIVTLLFFGSDKTIFIIPKV